MSRASRTGIKRAGSFLFRPRSCRPWQVRMVMSPSEEPHASVSVSYSCGAQATVLTEERRKKGGELALMRRETAWESSALE